MSTDDLPLVLQSLLQTLWIPWTPCFDSIGQQHGTMPVYLTHCLASPDTAVFANIQQRQ